MAHSETRSHFSRSAHINLDVALLRTFVAVVELGGVARAAEHIGRSQPAVSLQLKRLEDTIGTSLFRKVGRGLGLTENGDHLLSYAHRMLELNDETVASTAALRLSGSVRLGILQDFADDWLTKVLARFTRTYPSVVVEVKSDRSTILREALARKQLDFLLTFDDGGSTDVVKLGTVPLIWIGAKDFVLDRSSKLPLVVFDAPCEFRKAATKALAEVNWPCRVAFSSPSLSSQWSAVEAGLGISVRTPIGLRDSLIVLGRRVGLPRLPRIEVCLRGTGAKQDAPARKLQEIIIQTVQERLQGERPQ